MTAAETPVVITDRLPAAGWNLGGARVLLVPPAAAVEEFTAARATARLVLLSAAVAASLPPALLAAARRGTSPLVLVIDESLAAPSARPVARHVLGVLGVEP